MLQQRITGGPSQYVRYMDSNGDGVLNSVDLAKFMVNYAAQPGCAGESLLGGGGMDESDAFGGAEGDGFDDGEAVEALAQWLTEQFSPEELAAFVAQATVTAAEHADDAIGAEMMELLSYLL